MAVTITPGYEFSVDEVPTYGKFIAQAQGIGLSGLEFSDLAERTNYLFNSQESNGSGATSVQELEGGLWFDPSGEMWVTQRVYGWWGSSGYSGAEHVQVPLMKLRRGGWDSIRGTLLENGATARRASVVGDATVDAGYSPAIIRKQTNFVAQDTVGPLENGLSQDTPVSGSYFIMTGRGGGLIFASGAIGTFGITATYRWQSTTGLQHEFRRTDSPGSSPPTWGMGEVYVGQLFQEDDNSMTGDMLGWVYGRVVGGEVA